MCHGRLAPEDRRPGGGDWRHGSRAAPLRPYRTAGPSRSEAGQRLYTQADLLRLYQIVALRRLGFALPEIAARLDRQDIDPREMVRRQLAEVGRQMELQERLRVRLTAVLGALEQADEPTAEDLIDALEVVTDMEQYYTPEQMEKVEAHRRMLGEDGLRRGQEAWAELIRLMEAEGQRGTDPANPRVQELTGRWKTLVGQMSGGDAGTRSA